MGIKDIRYGESGVIPRQDSPHFLSQLNLPASPERQVFKPVVINALERRLNSTLLSTTRPTIGFTDRLYLGDPSFVFGLDVANFAARYELNNSAAFWEMLDSRPQDFKSDCLNAVHLSIIGATRDLLIQRGYQSDAIDNILTGMRFQGQETELSLDGRVMRPFAIYNAGYEGDTSAQTFSRAKEAVLFEAHDEAGYLPENIIVNADLSPGDIFALSSIGVSHFSNYGNQDNQNGVIISTVAPGMIASTIDVFSHVSNPAHRDTTLGAVIKGLSSSALRRGITMEEYLDKGGVGFLFAEFDYAGFYAAIAESLSKN